MRKMKYKTENGVFNTLAEVKGQKYEIIFEEVKDTKRTRTPKRQAMLDKFGKVAPSLANQI